MTRPATRVGRYVLFEGGRVVKLSHFARLMYALKLKTTIPMPVITPVTVVRSRGASRRLAAAWKRLRVL